MLVENKRFAKKGFWWRTYRCKVCGEALYTREFPVEALKTFVEKHRRAARKEYAVKVVELMREELKRETGYRSESADEG